MASNQVLQGEVINEEAHNSEQEHSYKRSN